MNTWVDIRQDWSMKLSQPLLTQQILDEMGSNQWTKGRTKSTLSSRILEHDDEGKQK